MKIMLHTFTYLLSLGAICVSTRTTSVAFPRRSGLRIFENDSRLVHPQIAPPLTHDDEIVGRSVPSIAIPSEVGDTLTGISSLSLAVAEWIIDPRQVREIGAVRCTATYCRRCMLDLNLRHAGFWAIL